MDPEDRQSAVELSNVGDSWVMDKQIEGIDEEISEIEELIKLQRQKVDLLHKKNALLKKEQSDARPAEKRVYPIVNPMQEKKEQNDGAASGAESPPPTADSSSNSTKQLTSSVKQLALIDSMQRLSRLSTDLANERNLLAWGRTAMAAARTALAFMNLTGNNSFGTGLVYTTSIGFGVVSVWMMMQGNFRYRQIKGILLLPNPPLHFGRISNIPVNVVLITLLVLLVIGNSSRSWSE